MPSPTLKPFTPHSPSALDRPYIRATEAAARYGIARSTLWLYVSQGRLPKPMKFGPRLSFWKVEDLDRAFEGNF